MTRATVAAFVAFAAVGFGVDRRQVVDHPFTCRTEHPISIDDSTG